MLHVSTTMEPQHLKHLAAGNERHSTRTCSWSCKPDRANDLGWRMPSVGLQSDTWQRVGGRLWAEPRRAGHQLRGPRRRRPQQSRAIPAAARWADEASGGARSGAAVKRPAAAGHHWGPLRLG